MTPPYQIAVNKVEHQTLVNRSRFLCYLYPCSEIAAAKAYLKQLQLAHPQASHHCHAFLTKVADNSLGYGYSDDGEPSGTAGKPMLAVLQGGGIGEVCAIVVRYFGGTKLGTGGLQRAYGDSVRQALVFLQSKTKIAMAAKSLACQYIPKLPQYAEFSWNYKRFRQGID
ncbi:MAG: YigZ family protein [Gammaproteobacteria bacterium]|nr:MAG: YigZ family protein [Gammaproteobacteria bacterium]